MYHSNAQPTPKVWRSFCDEWDRPRPYLMIIRPSFCCSIYWPHNKEHPSTSTLPTLILTKIMDLVISLFKTVINNCSPDLDSEDIETPPLFNLSQLMWRYNTFETYSNPTVLDRRDLLRLHAPNQETWLATLSRDLFRAFLISYGLGHFTQVVGVVQEANRWVFCPCIGYLCRVSYLVEAEVLPAIVTRRGGKQLSICFSPWPPRREH